MRQRCAGGGGSLFLAGVEQLGSSQVVGEAKGPKCKSDGPLLCITVIASRKGVGLSLGRGDRVLWFGMIWLFWLRTHAACGLRCAGVGVR